MRPRGGAGRPPARESPIRATRCSRRVGGGTRDRALLPDSHRARFRLSPRNLACGVVACGAAQRARGTEARAWHWAFRIDRILADPNRAADRAIERNDAGGSHFARAAPSRIVAVTAVRLASGGAGHGVKRGRAGDRWTVRADAVVGRGPRELPQSTRAGRHDVANRDVAATPLALQIVLGARGARSGHTRRARRSPAPSPRACTGAATRARPAAGSGAAAASRSTCA
jgi:hypothetical protein